MPRRRTLLVAAVVAAGMAVCGMPHVAEAGPAGAITDILKMVTTKSGDDLVETAASRAAKNSDAYAADMARLTQWDGEEVAKMIMEDAVKSGKYPRTVLAELGTYQRKLIDARTDLATKLFNEETSISGSLWNRKNVYGQKMSVDDMFEELLADNLNGEVPTTLLDYIRIVVGMAKVDKTAAEYAAKHGEDLPMVLTRVEADARDVKLLNVYLKRIERLGGPQWHGTNGKLMSVQENVRANAILDALKKGNGDSLDDFQRHTLEAARKAERPTPFQEAVRKADPGVDRVPHRVPDKAKYGSGKDALEREVADLSSDAARATDVQLKAAIRGAAAPLDAVLPDVAIDGIERTLLRVEALIDAVGIKSVAGRLNPAEAQTYTLASKRLKDTIERYPQIRQFMPQEGRPWYELNTPGTPGGRWTSTPPRKVQVDAFIKDMRAHASNAKYLAQYNKEISHYKQLLARAASPVKPPGFFKTAVEPSRELRAYIAEIINHIEVNRQAVDYRVKHRTGRFYPSSDPPYKTKLTAADRDTLKLLEQALADGR